MQKIGRWPVLNKNDSFQFACHKGLSCFTQCCRRLEVMLTPYDILRLKMALRLSSEVFLEKYTETVFSEKLGLPLIKLKRDTNGCPFLTAKGCQVYKDRPTVCRLYPLGRAFSDRIKKEVYFLIQEKECLGFREGKNWTVASWIKAQGVEEYDKYNEGFSELIFLKAKRPQGLNLKESQMFFMACYNLDAFREFVFKSSFLNRFDIPPKRVKKCEKEAKALLQLALDWLKFALFGQPVLRVKTS